LREDDDDYRSFGFGHDLIVYDEGECVSDQSYTDVYAGGRDEGSFPDDTDRVHFTRFEVWTL
jgi:hypothetical protein